MRKVLSFEGNYDSFSAKRVENIVILNIKENILLSIGTWTARWLFFMDRESWLTMMHKEN